MMYKVEIAPEEWLLCLDFASRQLITSYETYRQRGQSDILKLSNDIASGKVCELAVHKRFKGVGYPDFLVFNGLRKKGFDPDLMSGAKRIHVKSVTKPIKNPSWVFQPDDPLVTSPGENDYIALCVVDEGSVEFEFVKAADVISLYGPPVNLKLNKKCLYYNDLKELFNGQTDK